MSSGAATALGTGAILLWATLASLTALKGPIPPFQTTAMAFAIGRALMALAAALRARGALLKPSVAEETAPRRVMCETSVVDGP